MKPVDRRLVNFREVDSFWEPVALGVAIFVAAALAGYGCDSGRTTPTAPVVHSVVVVHYDTVRVVVYRDTCEDRDDRR